MMDQRLSFVREVPERYSDGRKQAEFLCECGTTVVRPIIRVTSGKLRSCGCLARENNQARKHGGHQSPTYSSWRAMKQRCLNPASKDYPRWGGKGVTICPEWASFDAFLADMGTRPPGTTIDRIDPDKGYEPGNCRWATPKEQVRNRRDLVTVATRDGPIALVDHAASLGISKGAAHLRLKRGTLEGINHD